MRLLVIHQNFPGQFGHLVQAWNQRPGWHVRALGRATAPGLSGFDKLTRYTLARAGNPNQHPYLRQMEDATLHGQAAVRSMLQLRSSGFSPDVILAHPGWGETLYAKDVYPDARLIHLCEWFYNPTGADLGFDPEIPVTLDDRTRIRTWNALHTLNLTNCDIGIAPTHWQRLQHPQAFLHKIRVQHEGIVTHLLTPDPKAAVRTPSGVVLRAGDPVITYVARNLEPYRGFHIFMRALEKIQAEHKTCHAVIVGGDGVSYGKRPKDAPTWREQMQREVKLDPARTHFVGRLPHAKYVRVLQVSAAHVYLTYPFVLSWSLLEAMGCGVPIIGSDTAPVREVMRDGVSGRLVPFFDAERIAQVAVEMMQTRRAQIPMRKRARAGAQAFSFEAGLQGYERAISAALGDQAADPGSMEPTERSLQQSISAFPSTLTPDDGTEAAPPAELIAEISRLERELLRLLSAGHSTKEIAALRNRSPATVRNQLSALYQKLGVGKRTEAVAKGIEHGLWDGES
jgi:glycosyltransferase involved in cell wall biosynthesis/DNA-binding CsgD family transcriptional regulator